MANFGGQESHRFGYDVFISFRGEDTRHNFIGYLRKDLNRKGIQAFIDDEMLKAGDVISPTLFEAIEESRVLIVVLSENYGSSTWCLEELVKILECSKKGNQQLVFPIFYHVDPSHVRHQKGSFGEAMAVHENRFGKDSHKVQSWRSALNQVAQLVGRHIKSGYESNDVEEIVKKVYDNIAPKCLDAKDQVGLEQRAEEVKSLLDMKPDDDIVLMLGIYGLGGIGKTELAKALYNNIEREFEAASFLANIREKSNTTNGPEDLQKTLLSEMFQWSETELGSTSRGICEIKRKLGKKKILLVLDDVDDREQLNYLAGGCDWFGSGSRIIITTRDEDLLIGHRVEKIYKMNELDDQHSLELFCRKAFGKSHPETGFEDLSTRALSYAKGLPLALKVIGCDLATEKELEYWESALEEYESHPHTKIQDVLQRSYDKLQDDAKQVFLDIACFFKGKRIKYVEMILKEFHAARNIKVLVNKSLLTVENDYLNMHDLIQDMGREVVRQEAPNNPGNRSRLWSYKDVVQVLTEDSGSDAIQGIMLDPPRREEVEWSGTAFVKMKRLRILIVHNTSFSSEPGHLPNYLRLLDWEDCPSKSFPPKFHPKDIIVLNLCNSYLTLEKPFKVYSCLTTMKFSLNQSITEMPSVYEVPNLKEIRLNHCRNLTKIHESVGLLKNLVFLSAIGCAKLIDFPRSMYLPSLEVLKLGSCERLKHFPDIVDKMNKKLAIDMVNTAIEELPDSIGNLTGLSHIDMSDSKKLRYVPPSLFMLQNLNTFKSVGCSNLGESFRMSSSQSNIAAANARSTLKIMNFKNCGLSDEDLHGILYSDPDLENLIASKNKFASLPECVKECVHLTSLDVSDCRELERIPECTSLRILDVSGCVNLKEISELPSTIQKVDASQCCSLTTETLDMLWDQVKKERRRLEVMMYQTDQKIPEWFDLEGDGGYPYFWVRGKFPIVALALFISIEKGAFRSRSSVLPTRHFVELDLVINGQCVPRKGSYNFKIEVNDHHVLVCDLRLLFSEEEWLGLDAFLVRDWNVVQVSCKSTLMRLTLSCWGVFVYKHETNMEDVQFMCPGPEYSCANITVAPPPTDLVQAVVEMFFDLVGPLPDDMPTFPCKEDFTNIIAKLSKDNNFLSANGFGLFELAPEERFEIIAPDPALFHKFPWVEQCQDQIKTLEDIWKNSFQDVLEGKVQNDYFQHLREQLTIRIQAPLMEKFEGNWCLHCMPIMNNNAADKDEVINMILNFVHEYTSSSTALDDTDTPTHVGEGVIQQLIDPDILAMLIASLEMEGDTDSDSDAAPGEDCVTDLDVQEMSFDPLNMKAISMKAMSRMKDVKDEAPREEHVTDLDAQEMNTYVEGITNRLPEGKRRLPPDLANLIKDLLRIMGDDNDEAPAEERFTEYLKHMIKSWSC